MSGETELKNQIQKAQRADELLNDPLIQEFIIAVKGKLMIEFEGADLDSEKKRLNAWQKMQVLNSFLEEFTKTIKKGQRANTTLIERAKEILSKRI